MHDSAVKGRRLSDYLCHEVIPPVLSSRYKRQWLRFFVIQIVASISCGFSFNAIGLARRQPPIDTNHLPIHQLAHLRNTLPAQKEGRIRNNYLYSKDLKRHDESCGIDRFKSSEQTRRDVLLTSLAAVTLLASPSKAYAGTKGSSSSSSLLEQLSIGGGKWASLSDKDGLFMSSTSIVPPTFATYATRFLLNYDSSVSQWWNDLKYKYSLLSAEERRNQLGKKFGCLARSVQIAVEEYVGSSSTAKRFEELAMLFLSTYGDSSGQGSFMASSPQNVEQQIAILFTFLPREYQPNKALRFMSKSDSVGNVADRVSSLPVSFQENWTGLLSNEYTILYDAMSDSLRVTPPITLFEIGIDDEFGQNAIATQFGPLSSTPLKRAVPISPSIYALFGISGATGCALTHTGVIPFDVVKTRLQTDSDKYSGFFDGFSTIAETEGWQALFLGAQATIVGYLWYGLSVYPSYTFFKESLTNSILTPDIATANTDAISLVAGALAAVIASIGLTPIETCRIRTVAEPETYRDKGLLGTARAVNDEDSSALYSGFPSLCTRQVIFGSVKFLAFERSSEAIFYLLPELRDSTLTSLEVSLIAGAFSGALSSFVSQPFDSVLTYIAKNSTGKRMGVLEGCLTMIDNDGVASLYRGLGSRSLWAALIISGQFFLYDIFRSLFGVSPDDLTQVFRLEILDSV